MEKDLKICLDWNESDAQEVRRNLVNYNMKNISEYTRNAISENVSITLKERNEIIVGGITGKIYFNCLHIDIFWVDESLRGQGHGKQLIKLAEELAAEKGCKLIKVDTFSFQAPDFYKSLGYQEYGILEDYPEGFKHYYFYKRI